VSSWWGGKVRQFRGHLTACVGIDERRQLADWLTVAELELFDSMHIADQRHGLDVVAALRAAGHEDPDLLLAGLFHDASKGRKVGVWPRVAWSLSEHYGSWIRRVIAWLPGFREAFEQVGDHPERSAALALAAGCSPVTADLIRHQSAPVDADAGEALRRADDAN
jgi:hypothetical protein